MHCCAAVCYLSRCTPPEQVPAWAEVIAFTCCCCEAFSLHSHTLTDQTARSVWRASLLPVTSSCGAGAVTAVPPQLQREFCPLPSLPTPLPPAFLLHTSNVFQEGWPSPCRAILFLASGWFRTVLILVSAVPTSSCKRESPSWRQAAATLCSQVRGSLEMEPSRIWAVSNENADL